MQIYTVFAVVVFAAILLYVVVVYNRMKKLTNLINEAWANIVTSITKRHDAVRALIKTTEGAARHESLAQTSVVALRNGSVADLSGAEQELQKDLVAIVESYPAMKSDKMFQDLAAKLVEIENDIQGSRLLFNRSVALYLRQLNSLPAGIFATALGFGSIDFFEADRMTLRSFQEPLVGTQE
jgi:LemA protein